MSCNYHTFRCQNKPSTYGHAGGKRKKIQHGMCIVVNPRISGRGQSRCRPREQFGQRKNDERAQLVVVLPRAGFHCSVEFFFNGVFALQSKKSPGYIEAELALSLTIEWPRTWPLASYTALDRAIGPVNGGLDFKSRGPGFHKQSVAWCKGWQN